MFNSTATKLELWVEMFLQVAFSFYIISAQCLMCELRAQVQLRTSLLSFRVRTDSDIVLDLDLTKKPDSSKYRCTYIWREHEWL